MRRAVAPLSLVLFLAACSAGNASTPSPAASPARCGGAAALGEPAAFTTPAGTHLAGVELGPGPTGVVLAHQNLSDLCEWLPFGQHLAERGYRVLAFDFAGDGESGPHQGDDRNDDDVAAAAGYLRAHGFTDLVLMGASKGGTAALSAAVTLHPAPVAVVTLSAPEVFGGVSATDAVPQLPCPALFLSAENDHPFAEAAQKFAATAPPTVPHQAFLAIGAEHGTGLLAGGQGKKVNELIDTFLTQHAPI